MTVDEELYLRLYTGPQIVALLGATPAVYAMHLPQGTTQPGIIYFRISDMEHPSNFGCDTGIVRCRYQVTSFAAQLKQARAIADAVRLTLQRYMGDPIQDIYVRNVAESYADAEGLYQIDSDFEVVYREVLPV